ncbi:DEAD/DEAH box helicase family protein [Rhodococcus qingshengii]|uniref:DEAD/DEAH box helicase family protein n=1 Tax=Rhodococcus qingshengii TaxID=334542 RepID=UPI001F22D213|nr:DEAD/DEAH box helicase family protein [Rhodococcus qingshengii]
MESGTTGGLRHLDIESRYRSDSHSVVSDFYVPILEQSVTYSRAVGYFTGTSMKMLARGIDRIAQRGGTIRIIASPHLTVSDIEEIDRGYDRRRIVERAACRELSADLDPTILDGLSVVGSLIAAGKLDIKLAFVKGPRTIGIYHEKMGIVRDEYGDLVAFTGSSNETLGGLVNNFESIEVYRGWISGDGPRALRLESDFEELWANVTENLDVEEFPDVARDRLIQIASERQVTSISPQDDPRAGESDHFSEARQLRIPESLEPRDYQRDAVNRWLGQRGRGILKMATGTGKTKTALFAATRIAEVENRNERPLILLIVVPLLSLVDQWTADIREFGVQPIAVYEDSKKWIPQVEGELRVAKLGLRPVVIMVATNRSFSGSRFQSILGRINQPMMLIADEAHNLGSPAYRDLLPEMATYRLGLSATPERWLDDTGTDALVDYFGPIAFELGLKEAIEDLGALCRYYYYPRIVELTTDENQRYADLTSKIGKAYAAGEAVGDPDSDSPLGALLRKRAAVLGHAQAKIDALRRDLEKRTDQWFQLVYCAEGNAPADAGDPPGPNQLSEVAELIGNSMRMQAHAFTSETRRPLRKELLSRFASGDDLQVLIAMRCLDEGVDIPDARIGYLLASSSNPRQFIQRRGRILRRAPGKDTAIVIDYIAVPPSSEPINFDTERNLMIRELVRVNEFAKIAENYSESLEVLRPLKERYELMDY